MKKLIKKLFCIALAVSMITISGFPYNLFAEANQKTAESRNRMCLKTKTVQVRSQGIKGTKISLQTRETEVMQWDMAYCW
ncbi:MAG: hypothetical protein SOR72_06245 [Hornefia sp.]|nr:hypothetical protein [Hornefia sp.]